MKTTNIPFLLNTVIGNGTDWVKYPEIYWLAPNGIQ